MTTSSALNSDIVPSKKSFTGLDRRRCPRYRFSAPIRIRTSGGAEHPGISVEISQSGMSAVSGDPLRVGETVELEPVAGGKVAAVIRRNLGRVYGFEFLGLTADQERQIDERCKMLPHFHCGDLDI